MLLSLLLLIIGILTSLQLVAMEERETRPLTTQESVIDLEAQDLTEPNYSITTRQWHDSWSDKLIKCFGNFDYPGSSCKDYPNQEDESCCNKKCCSTAPWNVFGLFCLGAEIGSTADCFTSTDSDIGCLVAEYSLIPLGIFITGSLLWTTVTIFTTYKDNTQYYPHRSFMDIYRRLPLTQDTGFLSQDKKILQTIITYIGQHNAYPQSNEQYSYNYVQKLLTAPFSLEQYRTALENSPAVQKYNKESDNQISAEIAEHISKFVEYNQNNVRILKYTVANLVQIARYASDQESFSCGKDAYKGVLTLKRKPKSRSWLADRETLKIQGSVLQAWLDCYMTNKAGEIDIHLVKQHDSVYDPRFKKEGESDSETETSSDDELIGEENSEK